MDHWICKHTIIDKAFQEGNQLIEYLTDKKELSMLAVTENIFRKTFLLSVASFFENEITQLLIDIANYHSANNELIVTFMKKNGISRKYHTLFKWESKNVNDFLSNFGVKVKTNLEKEINSNNILFIGMHSFLHLGHERNKLVHQNYAEYYLEKSAKEIYLSYHEALIFVNYLKSALLKAHS